MVADAHVFVCFKRKTGVWAQIEGTDVYIKRQGDYCARLRTAGDYVPRPGVPVRELESDTGPLRTVPEDFCRTLASVPVSDVTPAALAEARKRGSGTARFKTKVDSLDVKGWFAGGLALPYTREHRWAAEGDGDVDELVIAAKADDIPAARRSQEKGASEVM